MTKLYACRQDDLTLENALSAVCSQFQPGTTLVTALLYTPRRCVLGRMLEVGAIEAPVMARSGIPLRVEPLSYLGDVFEARVFNSFLELRWHHSGGGKGAAVLLSENPVAVNDWITLEERSCHQELEQRYLLWGKGANHRLAGGWGVVAEARVGALPVPLPVLDQQRVVLSTREYLKEVDTFGNVTVIEERLMSLKVDENPGQCCNQSEVGHE